MRILVLNGSPRSKGNTKQMVEAFQAGAEAVGHQVDVADVCRIGHYISDIIRKYKGTKK